MFDDLICPKCKHDMSYISDTQKSKFLEFKKDSYHSYYDGSFSGHRWTEIITCRKCGNKWEVTNSDI